MRKGGGGTVEMVLCVKKYGTSQLLFCIAHIRGWNKFFRYKPSWKIRKLTKAAWILWPSFWSLIALVELMLRFAFQTSHQPHSHNGKLVLLYNLEHYDQNIDVGYKSATRSHKSVHRALDLKKKNIVMIDVVMNSKNFAEQSSRLRFVKSKIYLHKAKLL